MDVEEFMCFRHYLSFQCRVELPAESICHAHLIVPNNDPVALSVARLDDAYSVLAVETLIGDYSAAHRTRLRVETTTGAGHEFDDVNTRHFWSDSWRRLTADLHAYLQKERATANVLEIGARIRKDTKSVARRSIIPPTANYTGLDIVPGENVDVVGDIHQLSRYFRPGQFDVIYSDFVFEHVLMPWRAVIEMNKVLSLGGDVFVNTNQSIALHDMPWDFWRFSDTVWLALFNEYTGFQIVAAAIGEPVRLTPKWYHEGFVDHHEGMGFQASAVWARKIGESRVRWDVDPGVLLARLGRTYPREMDGSGESGELTPPVPPPAHYSRWWYPLYLPFAPMVPRRLRRAARRWFITRNGVRGTVPLD